MSQHETPHDVEPDAQSHEGPQTDSESESLTDDLDGFDADEPAEQSSSPSQDDWPDGEPDADPDDAVVTADDPVSPAVGERFADLHAERPWLLPGIAAGAVLVVVGIAVLLRRP